MGSTSPVATSNICVLAMPKDADAGSLLRPLFRRRVGVCGVGFVHRHTNTAHMSKTHVVAVTFFTDFERGVSVIRNPLVDASRIQILAMQAMTLRFGACGLSTQLVRGALDNMNDANLRRFSSCSLAPCFFWCARCFQRSRQPFFFR